MVMVWNEIILGRKVIDWKGNDDIYTECFKKWLQKHQNQKNNQMFVINKFNVIGIKNKISKGANKNVNIKLLSIIKL